MPADELAAQKVPVLGSTTLTEDLDGTRSTATVLVNGVRRIPGATVLYYSAGLPEGAAPTDWYGFVSSSRDHLLGNDGVASVRLVDFAGEKIYTPIYEDDGSAKGRIMASPSGSWPDFEPGGTFYTFFAVLPELPDGLTSVDVRVGHGDIVQNAHPRERYRLCGDFGRWAWHGREWAWQY